MVRFSGILTAKDISILVGDPECKHRSMTEYRIIDQMLVELNVVLQSTSDLYRLMNRLYMRRFSSILSAGQKLLSESELQSCTRIGFRSDEVSEYNQDRIETLIQNKGYKIFHPPEWKSTIVAIFKNE